MLIAEKFISDLVVVYGKRTVSTDGGTWYPLACQFITYRPPYSFSFREKLDIEYDILTGSIESFDDYILNYVKNWQDCL